MTEFVRGSADALNLSLFQSAVARVRLIIPFSSTHHSTHHSTPPEAGRELAATLTGVIGEQFCDQIGRFICVGVFSIEKIRISVISSVG